MDENLDIKPTFDQATTSVNNNDQQQSSISSFYPLPPMRYIKQFTDINVRNRCTPLPPKPFIPGSYLMFGQNITIDDTIIRSLESQGLRRLYPREYDHKRELKKINASILVNFLDLIDVLIRCPDTQKREEKCNDLQLLFITMHHLINELRPHQARESIRVCLRMQKKQREETSAKLSKQIERIQDIIRTAIKNIKDKDINDLLQETLPENFQSNTNILDDNHSPVLNGHYVHKKSNDGNNDVDADINNDDDDGDGDGGDIGIPLRQSAITKMTELDAFMCDLIDEQF
ncbi:Mediator of RNA polymerase II transcription subunit 7 [Dermatophagoides pteronyssinus]|uniref:Mediator of RNA polymerase II transcription subunit 7 n=1 Tax=Dermatophagoides pteronyssinus TaxID=6956 RepID=A0ABQ8JIR1_DERPT|nr:Mediator of RNA polymerase II transcription subunit 7 [Dermatophagoides pteronyssinus]